MHVQCLLVLLDGINGALIPVVVLMYECLLRTQRSDCMKKNLYYVDRMKHFQ